MGIRLYREPQLEGPDLLACWPGIGNIGILAVNALKSQIRAEELGEIEPWDFFYPKRVVIRDSVLTDLEFPSSKFYFKRLAKKDLVVFIGEEQPAGTAMYAQGEKAYQMANLVLDVAENFGCRRVYTSGAAVSLTHHTAKPRVWAVTTRAELNREVKSLTNTALMGEMEGIGGGSITGLNGLLLGLAKKRGLDAICLMGEIPDYLSSVPFPYPRASKSVLEVLSGLLGTEVGYGGLDEMAVQLDELIAAIYDKFPPEIKERIEQRRAAIQTKPETITEEEGKWIKEHIDEFFKGGGGGERRS